MNGSNPDAIELAPLPLPRSFGSDMDRPVPFDAVTTVSVDCPDAEATPWLSRHFAEWFGNQAPQVVANVASKQMLPNPTANVQLASLENGNGKTGNIGNTSLSEAYAVSAGESGVRIAANTLAGVRWAAYSLRQLAIAKRGTFKTEGRILPTLSIEDAPHLAFRGIHLCWFPEVRPAQIERAIRLAALLKFNYAVIEPWGVFASERHPWFGWPEKPATKEEIARLVGIGRDLGITLVPQLNVFGHASSARSCTLKHATLDLHPEYEPLFEPGGWNWCLTNPETQRVLRELIAELHDDFGNPPFFHLGCDEAQPPSCPECRKRRYGELVCEHLTGLADFVRQRGARAMIWHDMLLDRDDPRWEGYVRCGSPLTATLADTLPRDVIVCDWQYSYGDMKETRKDWPTMAYFHEKGFPVCGCPWMNYNAMKPMADFISGIGGFGLLETTWHHLRGGDWTRMFRCGAAAAWGTPTRAPGGDRPTTQFDTEFATALRLVGHDMGLSDYLDTGILNYQVPPSWFIDNG